MSNIYKTRCSSIIVPPAFFDQDNFQELLLLNLKSKGSVDYGNWSMVFACTLDSLWWTRNEWVFKQTNPSSIRTTVRAKHLVDDIQNSDKMLTGFQRKASVQLKSSDINWVIPNAGFVKLNCDGAVRDLLRRQLRVVESWGMIAELFYGGLQWNWVTVQSPKLSYGLSFMASRLLSREVLLTS